MATTQNLLILLIFTTTLLLANGEPQVPCYFIFGDSLMDNGNNNRLVTEAKVDFPPYGIDFAAGPTGRFSNGRNSADVIAQLLGFEKFIPPYATAKGNDIITGVNYASGAAGIRDETAQHLGGRISMDKQIVNHWLTILKLNFLVGKGNIFKTQKYLNKCLYTVGIGNNDYINNYLVPKYYTTSTDYTPEQYADALVEQYSQQLQTLYKSGARMFGIFAAGYSGCTPAIMTEYGTNACVDSVNGAIAIFNSRLNATLNDLNKKLVDAKFIFIDGSTVQYPIDINVTDTPCCKVSSSSGKGQCVANEVPCSNRENYFFWDAFHPTERINVLTGTQAYETLSPFYASSSDAIALSSSKDKETRYVSDA